MRITTKMLNDSARKAGLPVNRMSLLDCINTGNNSGKKNSLLEALNRNRTVSVDTGNQKKYEKLEKTAENLADAAATLQADGEKDLFAQAREGGDKQKVCDSIQSFLDRYNSSIRALKNTDGVMDDFYRQMLTEAPEGWKEQLAELGITFSKDGTAKIDTDQLKASDIDRLEAAFGGRSEFVSRVNYLSTRIANYAQAGAKSYSTSYSSRGDLYTGNVNSRFDFRR